MYLFIYMDLSIPVLVLLILSVHGFIYAESLINLRQLNI